MSDYSVNYEYISERVKIRGGDGLDAELIMLLLNDPEKGISRMIDNYAGLIYTIVLSKLSYVGTKEDIEECVSDIFYEVYNRACEIDLQKGSIKSYLSVVAKRRAIDCYRKLVKHTGNTTYLDAIEYDKMKDDKTHIENHILDKETKDLLVREIKNLGEPDSEIIIRKYFLGQSTKCIASDLKMKINTVDKKASRALDKLKRLLGGSI